MHLSSRRAAIVVVGLVAGLLFAGTTPARAIVPKSPQEQVVGTVLDAPDPQAALKSLSRSRITSWSVPLYGGRGASGNSYDGVAGRGALNVGWEVRQYVEFTFNYAWVHAYPCEQIRGGATGLYSVRTNSCNLS